MDLPKKTLEILKINKIEILNEFYSKNNKVYLANSIDKNNISRKIVIKEYIKGSLENEKERLIQLRSHGVLVPLIYGYYNNLMFLEYINGQLLIDKLSEMEVDYSKDLLKNSDISLLIMSIVNWFEQFYFVVGNDNIRGDINLRNFIINKEVIYGIDFEKPYRGSIEKDVGRMCAFILTYNPSFTFLKKDISKRLFILFKERLNLDKTKIKSWVIKELKLIEKRRCIAIEKYVFDELRNEGLIE